MVASQFELDPPPSDPALPPVPSLTVAISVGNDVDVVVRDGVIVITPAARVRGKCSLRDLVSRIPKGHRPKEIGWGPAVGKEVW